MAEKKEFRYLWHDYIVVYCSCGSEQCTICDGGQHGPYFEVYTPNGNVVGEVELYADIVRDFRQVNKI